MADDEMRATANRNTHACTIAAAERLVRPGLLESSTPFSTGSTVVVVDGGGIIAG